MRREERVPVEVEAFERKSCLKKEGEGSGGRKVEIGKREGKRSASSFDVPSSLCPRLQDDPKGSLTFRDEEAKGEFPEYGSMELVDGRRWNEEAG